jgi:hypothetical protein
MDGSPTTTTTVELEGVPEPAVVTKVKVRRADPRAADPLKASCLGAHGLVVSGGHHGATVERIGVEGSSVTLTSASGLHACDDSQGSREAGRRWCGIAFGVLTHGRLEDPRLDVAGCLTASGHPVGFAWISAGSQTRYVAVAERGYSEVYEPAGGVPIRIATATGVGVDGSRASFRLTEHDARGRLLRRYELEAVAAG